MTDLTSPGWIVAKGVLFAVLLLASGGLLFWAAPSIRSAFLLVVLVWSAARFYYFLFYVLEKYVDPRLKYAGLWALLREIGRRGRSNRKRAQ